MNTVNNAFEVPNYRQIKATFVSPTNSRSARIKLFETKRYSDDKTETKFFSYSYEYADVMEQAFHILKKNGFNVVARCSEYGHYTFLCDNWGDEFKKVKELVE